MTGRDILERAFLAGTADLRRHSSLLDRINVFPVVDADTGANMGQTLEAGASALREGSTDFTSAVLLGARGNSGVILAQFVVGLFDSLPSGAVEPGHVVDGISRGRDMAYGAVSNPVEGTMLTVMTDLADLLSKMGSGGVSMDDHREIEEALSRSVARTPTLMERLAQAGVVDSGALGFHIFASGLTLALPALRDRSSDTRAIEDRISGDTTAPMGEITGTIDPAFLKREVADASRLRYCMDVVIETTQAPPDGWTAPFEEIGASVDAVMREGIIKLHVHCDDPDSVRTRAARLGKVVRAQAEDMSLGLVRSVSLSDREAPISKTAPIRVMGDSSMTLPEDLASALGISRIENHVNVHGKMVPDCDLDRVALFARMREGMVFTTAQTSREEVRRFFDRQLDAPGDIIYMAVGRAYTGTQDLVRSVLADHPLGKRVHIVDTGAASGQQGLAALAVAREASEASDLEDLLEYSRLQATTCREYLVIDSLEFLSRSGRVGKVRSAFAGALGIRPIVGHGGDGAITYAKTRSHRSALSEIISRVVAHPGEGSLLVMLEHTDNLDRVNQAREALDEALPADVEFVISPLSSTSAVHMGPGTWGVAVTRIRP